MHLLTNVEKTGHSQLSINTGTRIKQLTWRHLKVEYADQRPCSCLILCKPTQTDMSNNRLCCVLELLLAVYPLLSGSLWPLQLQSCLPDIVSTETFEKEFFSAARIKQQSKLQSFLLYFVK